MGYVVVVDARGTSVSRGKPRGVSAMALELPNYRIIEKLGVGAQSRLFRARCMRSGKDYTVKYVTVQKPEDMTIVELLRAEHEIGMAVDHPSVRKVFELRMLRRRLRVRGAILFMEYVDGESMSEKGDRSVDDVLRLFVEVSQGLHAMHMAGFVHADLKPGNILVNTEGRAKIIDLGQSARRHAAKVRVQGSIHYMAPEQVERGNLDQRTDVFGLGATLHRILTGKPIATGMNQTVNLRAQGMIGRLRMQDETSPTEGLPAPIARLIADCCAQSPSERPEDMLALITRLELTRTMLTKRETNRDGALDDDELDPFDDEMDDARYADADPLDSAADGEPSDLNEPAN